ncbi:MAG: sulfurtransferase [Geobacter sp.]|nr:sulfurtransferase [Geobacter sp.]
MVQRNRHWRFISGSLAFSALMVSWSVASAADQASALPSDAKICLNCHKPQANNLRGHWESVAMKSSSIQLKIDDRAEILKFDKSKLQVLNTGEKGDVEKQLRSIKKGHEVRIEYTEKDGAKYAQVVSSKPPVKLSDAEKVSTGDVEKLVAQGPQKGKYTLIDSRPGPKFKEGAIPTAISLPFPQFDKMVDKLPADKNSLVIFYCSGVTCNMSPGSLQKAKKLGYTNAKVFVDGMPEWFNKHYGVTLAKDFKDAYKDMPFVLLDTRKPAVAEKGFIPGAATFTAVDAKSLKSLPDKKMKAPIIVYDADGKENATAVAAKIAEAGYVNVVVLRDGIAGWEQAKLPVATGALATKIVYVPKPKPGEIDVEEFRKYLTAIPADTILVDVRLPEEVKEGSVKGAVNIPAAEIDQNLAKLPKDKKIVAYCNTGTQAEMAYHTLKAKGYTNIHFLNAKLFFDDGSVEISK